MPWTAADADRHIKGLSDRQKEVWAEIANRTLEECLRRGQPQKVCEAKAIRAANTMARHVNPKGDATRYKLNRKGYDHARKLIEAGKISFEAWSKPTLSDFGGDIEEYSLFHLGRDPNADPDLAAAYAYPFGKNGKVYYQALIAIRAATRGARGALPNKDIFEAAGQLIELVKEKRGDAMVLEVKHRQLSVVTGRLDNVQIDEEAGVLTADVILSREGVLPYEENGTTVLEYIPGEELASPTFLSSCNGKPVTDGHPPAGFVDMDTLSIYAKGVIHGPIRVDKDEEGRVVVVARETIWDDGLISEIKEGRKRQVSIGRWAVVIEEQGEWRGQRYDRRQTELVLNHVAHTDHGRQGDACRVLIDELEPVAVVDADAILMEVLGGDAEGVVGRLEAVIARYADDLRILSELGPVVSEVGRVLAFAYRTLPDEARARIAGQLSAYAERWPEEYEQLREYFELPLPDELASPKDTGGDLMLKIGDVEVTAPPGMEVTPEFTEWVSNTLIPAFTNDERIKELEEKVAQLDALEARVKELEEKLADAEKRASEAEAQAKAAKDELEAAKKRYEDAIGSEVSERLRLVRAISQIQPDYKWDGKTTEDLRKDLIKALNPEAKVDEWDEVYLRARADIILDEMEKVVGASLGAALLKPGATREDANSRIAELRKKRLQMYKGGGG